jgi:hypothetical protein
VCRRGASSELALRATGVYVGVQEQPQTRPASTSTLVSIGRDGSGHEQNRMPVPLSQDRLVPRLLNLWRDVLGTA